MDLVVSGILNFLTEQEAIGKAEYSLLRSMG